MASVSVDDETKQEWDELKPDDLTHGEFAEELLAAYRRDNGEIVDVGKIVDNVEKQIAAEVELSSYRGTRDALNDVLEQ